MAGYTAQTWTLGASGGTPLSASRLTTMETGIAEANTRYYCRIYASATSQTLTNNALTNIDFTNTETNDSASYFTVDLVTNNSITVLNSGLYLCTWFVKYSGGSVGERSCTLYNRTANTDLADASQYLGNVAVQVNVGTSSTVRLSANTALGVRAWVDGGSNATVVSSLAYHTFLAVAYLGS